MSRDKVTSPRGLVLGLVRGLDPASRLGRLVVALMALTGTQAARADIAPPVEIRMSFGTPQAVSGAEYSGAFEVEVYRAGTLSDIEFSGKGWAVLSLKTASAAGWMNAGIVHIPFRARPTDADAPIRLSLRYNGRRVTKTFDIGPSYFARAGKPHHSVRVDTDGGPVLGIGNAGEEDASVKEPEGGLKFSGPIQVVGRIVYSRPGRDLSDQPDGDFDDPEDIPPVYVGLDNIDVQIWDSDPVGHETIWSGYTDENGYFDTGVVPWDDSGDDPDLVLYYETETSGVVDVTDNSIAEWTYTFESAEVENFTGSYYDFGTHTPGDASVHPALHIFNSVVRTRRFILEKPGYTTPAVQVEWPDDSNGSDAAWYEGGSNEIHLSTGRSWRNDTVSHEYGHHFMDALYVNDMPEPEYCIDPSCDPDPPDDCGHCMWCQETDHDALNEGFPNWLADIVTRDYPDRYTHDVNGPPYVPLYTRPQEWTNICDDSAVFEDPIKTEGFVGALLRDIDDATQDDHDDDPDPNVWSSDGIYDMLCLGPNPVFYVLDAYEPVTVTDFISGFLAMYPQYTDRFWPTAYNVGGPAYVSNFPTDTQPPGVVSYCRSPTHPMGQGGSLPCITFEWTPAPDDAWGACEYSFRVTTNPGGQEPDDFADPVTPTDECMVSGQSSVWELGEHYVSIKARDNAGNWSSSWATFGPFEIIDCNSTGILDACDISCSHQGITGSYTCTTSISPCPGLPGCGLANDCQPNLVPDSCDIASGTSEDCNLDGRPDECENMFHWDGTSGSWHAAGNWYEGEVPQEIDGFRPDVCINVTGDQTITYSEGSLESDSLACSENLAIQGSTNPCDLMVKGASFVRGDLTLGNMYTSLEVTYRLDIGGLFRWNGLGDTRGPKLKGSGTTYANGGVLISSYVELIDHHLVLDGNSTSVCTGNMAFGGTSTFEIRPGSIYEHQGGHNFLGGWFEDQFINAGTLIKSVDTGDSVIYVPTDNSGLIHAQTGTLRFYLGGTATGDFLADPGASLEFIGGTWNFQPGSSIVAQNVRFPSGGAGGSTNIRGTYNVSQATTVENGQVVSFTSEADIVNFAPTFNVYRGSVNFNTDVGGATHFDTFNLGTPTYGGTASFNSGNPVDIDTLTINGGSLRGPSTVMVNTQLTWGGENMNMTGPGITNINCDSVFQSTGGNKSVTERTVNNAGTLSFQGRLHMSEAELNNLPGGVVDIPNDGTFLDLSSSAWFNNAGTFVKSGGTGTSKMMQHFVNSGTVEVQTGTLELYGGYGITQTQTAGQTTLHAGTSLVLSSNAVYNMQGGSLRGEGTVSGRVSNAGGSVEPGLSVGQLNVNGNYTQGADAALKIEISGADPGQADKLVCTGSASLAGTLEIVLIGGFRPRAGDAFDVLDWGALAGAFNTVDLPALSGALSWDDANLYATGVLSVGPVVPADFDRDGDVDAEDVGAFVACGSGPAIPAAAGCEGKVLDGDNDIDQEDFAVLQWCYSGENNPGDPGCGD